MGSDKSARKNSKRKLESTRISDEPDSCEFEPVLSDVELVWRGKRQLERQEVADLRPIERVCIPPDFSSESCNASHSSSSWINKIIRGDNRLVMNSLLYGELKDEIRALGGIKLVYIDPPFLVGTDFNMSVVVGEHRSEKVNVFQEFAYRDSWKKGPGSYLNMMYQRLKIIRRLLADDGSLWVHCDWKANFMIRSILDEIFGADAFRNEIIWYYTNKIPDTRKRQYTNATDTIFYYAKSSKSIFNWQFEKRDKPIKVSRMKKVEGKKVYPRGEDGKCIYVTREERTADNVWKIPLLHAHPEMWGYPTQKPVRLLERIIMTATNQGDLVADFFCGSGSLLEAAQKLGRRWIGCDIGKIATHTCRKRMINFIRTDGDLTRTSGAFDIVEATDHLNSSDPKSLGVHGSDATLEGYLQTTIFDFEDNSGPGKLQPADIAKMISRSAKGDFATFLVPRHISINSHMIQEVLNICSNTGVKKLDVMGFDYENSVEPWILEKANSLSVGVCLKKVTRELQLNSKPGSGDQESEILAYFKATTNLGQLSAQITLSDFGLYCVGMDQEVSTENGKIKSSRILIDSQGRLVRSISKRNDETRRHVLTGTWSDWIDYWAVDFDYGNKQIISPSVDNYGSTQNGPVFTSVWHSFRTPKKRSIELSTPFWKYVEAGNHKIAVKVVDIFGHGTERIFDVDIP